MYTPQENKTKNSPETENMSASILKKEFDSVETRDITDQVRTITEV